MRLKKYIVLDEFFEDADSIREEALKLDFVSREQHKYNNNYEGLRTDCLSNINPDFYDQFSRQCVQEYYGFCTPDAKIYGEMHFHINRESDMHEEVYRDIGRRIHTDGTCLFTAIAYLTPHAPHDTGTEIWFNNSCSDVVANLYNRLIIFPSGETPHAPRKFFGNNKYDGRLSLIFFLLGVE
jgi:hypothetical protein